MEIKKTKGKNKHIFTLPKLNQNKIEILEIRQMLILEVSKKNIPQHLMLGVNSIFLKPNLNVIK